MRKTNLFIMVLVLVLSGCGQKHKAKSLIGSFVKENTTLSDMYRQYDKLDSTYRLTDSLITVMRQQTSLMPQFKKGINYGKFVKGDALLYQRVRFVDDHDTLHITFYMDKNLSEVVACKEN